MNGETRLRLELIVYNGHRKLLILESRAGKISYSSMYIPHQDWVCLDQCMQFTAAGVFQWLSIDIMNGETRLRLELIVYNGHHKLTLESRAMGKLRPEVHTFHTEIGLRLELIVYKGHRKLTLESRAGKIKA
eukprot:scaffold108587_cov75-Cyclotella_meneghiniana.AAC.2